jgi:hypothetical protein
MGQLALSRYGSDVQCLHRWTKVLNPEHVKGPWWGWVRATT